MAVVAAGHCAAFRRRTAVEIELSSLSGRILGYRRVPSEPGSADHSYDVLESSLRKSLILEEVMRLAEVAAYREHIPERGSQHLPEDRAKGFSEVAEAVGIAPCAAVFLIGRAYALDGLLVKVMIPTHRLEALRSAARRVVADAKEAGEFASFLRAHLDGLRVH